MYLKSNRARFKARDPSPASQVALVVKNLPINAGEMLVQSLGSERHPGGRAWQPIPVFLPGESHGQRILAGCSLSIVGKSRT